MVEKTNEGMFGLFTNDDFNGMVFSLSHGQKSTKYTYHGKFQEGRPHGFGVL